MASQLTPAILADPDALRQYPASAPPPGITPNFGHPENRGPVLIAVGGLMIALMTILLAIRIYTKARIVRKFSWDDLTVSLAALGAIAMYVAFCWGKPPSFHFLSAHAYRILLLEIEKGPFGKHQYDVHLSDILDHNYIIGCSAAVSNSLSLTDMSCSRSIWRAFSVLRLFGSPNLHFSSSIYKFSHH